ncbi:U32 family peptidase [Photobacterium damselae]|uniref:peptidase U32 family protein n=1 Tax=Photobacterium damselae TaxID=38293 RepID=UPI00254317B1
MTSASELSTTPLGHISNRIELLAPAKNADFGIEAIKHGADAVYIGGPAFGARAAAGNSIEDIQRLCEFAHRYHAQVFVALNTILSDSELAQAEQLIWDIYHAGADALIVQDMGILQLNLPPLALHASTQIDNRDKEKVEFLEQVGFTQVVLARELSLPQIHDIAAHTNMQIEFFIHGALCVSYSGQCYISHAFTNRSANRGSCSQMCRLPCNLKTRQGEVLAENQHLLSLKDNNQTANLEALIDAGVRSFKIEGRLKDLSYVKNVTAHYRRELDAIMARRPELYSSSHGRVETNFNADPDKSFNRGKTDYFVQDRNAGISDFRTPKYIGQKAGKVRLVGKDFIELDSDLEFNNGDGIAYFSQNYLKVQQSDDKLQGIRVNRADGNRLYFAQMPKDLKVGMVVYRNFDKAFEDLLAKDSSRRRIGVSMILADSHRGLMLTLTDDYGFSAQVEFECEKTPANDAEKTLANIRKQLNKLGNTDFEARDIQVKTSQMWFTPASVLNGLRRDGIAALEQARFEGYQRPAPGKYNPDVEFPKRHLSYLGNVANTSAKAFYQQHGVIEVEDAYELNKVYEDVPLMITKHCLRFSFNQCPKQVEGIKAEPMILEMGGETLKLVFDCLKCEMKVVGHNKQ